MGNKKLELRALKLDESDLNSLFLLEVSDGLWSFTTDALDEQREKFGRALNYWVEKNPDSTKADLRPFQPLLCFHSENWNRVLYLNKEASKHRVFFVDLGLSDLIDLESAESHFRIIEPEFWNNRPAQVIMTPQLYEVTPEQMYDLQVSDHRMRMENAEVSSHWDWPIQIVTGKLFSSRTKETGPIERPIPISRFLRPKLPPQRIIFNKETKGEIIAKSDNENLWFVRSEDEPVLEEINRIMHNSIKYLRKPADPPKVGDLLLSKFEKQYYRSQVVDTEGDVPKVLFVDFGNTDDLLERHYELPEGLLNFAPLALKTKLLDSPVEFETLHEGDNITLTYLQVSQDHVFTALLTKYPSKPIPSINIEEPILSPAASSTILTTSPQPPQKKENANESLESNMEAKRIFEQHLRVMKESIPRRLTHIKDSFELTIMSKNEEKEYTFIEGFLEDDAETLLQLSNSISPTESIDEAVIDDLVVVHSKHFDARPVRGRIVGVTLDTISVHLIDYGMIELHQLSHVYKYQPLLDEEYQHAFAVKAAVWSSVKFGLTETLTFRMSTIDSYSNRPVEDYRDINGLPLLYIEDSVSPVKETPTRETCLELPSALELKIDLTDNDELQKHQDNTQFSTYTISGRKIVLQSAFKCGKRYECMFLNVRDNAIPNSEKFSVHGKKEYLISLCLKEHWEDLNSLIKEGMDSSLKIPLSEVSIGTDMDVIVKDNSYAIGGDDGWRRARVLHVPGEKPRNYGRVLPVDRFFVREVDTEKSLILRSTRIFPTPENLACLDTSLPKKMVLRTDSIEKYRAGSAYTVKIIRRRKDNLYVCEVDENIPIEEVKKINYDEEFEANVADLQRAFTERNKEKFKKAFSVIENLANEVF